MCNMLLEPIRLCGNVLFENNRNIVNCILFSITLENVNIPIFLICVKNGDCSNLEINGLPVFSTEINGVEFHLKVKGM